MGAGGARPTPFTIVTIKYKVAVYPLAERADTFTLFHLYTYLLCAPPITWFYISLFLLVNSLTGSLANRQLKKLKEPTMITYLWIPKHMPVST